MPDKTASILLILSPLRIKSFKVPIIGKLAPTFVSNKKLSLEELKDFIGNYKSKHSEVIFGDLRRLKDSYPYKPNFAFLCDFEHYNRYKVWDISFSGNYPQFYIEHNIYF